MAFSLFATILAYGVAAGLGIAGSVGAANILAAPGMIDNIRNQINGALAPTGVRI